MILFGGLVNIPMWGYYWGMTAAQIELLACDQPLVVYNHKKKDKDKDKRSFKKASELDIAKAKLKWQEEQKADKPKFDFSQFTQQN